MGDEVEEGFAAALALSGSAGSYAARIGASWSQGRAAFGGLVAGLLARAAEKHVPEGRSLRSAVVDFVAPAAPGAVDIHVQVLREGRALTHTEARMTQAGAVVAIFVAAYGEARTSSLRVQGAAAPAAADPETLQQLPYFEGVAPRFTKNFDFRLCAGKGTFARAQARIDGYVRYPGGGPTDAAGVLGLVDAWPPAIFPILERPAPTSSVTWMIDIVGQLPKAGSESAAFYRYIAEAVAAGDGYGSCEARLWAPDGQLLAASRQLIVEFS